MNSKGLRQAREKMQAAGVDPVAIDVFAHYYRLIERGETGMIAENTIDPLDMDVDRRRRGRRRDRRRGHREHRGDQAQRWARDLDGHGPRQVTALRAPRALLPRRDRPTGAAPAPGVRRHPAAHLHEQLPHLGRHPCRAGPLQRPRGGGSAARVPAEQGAQARRQGPAARRLAPRPRARVVSARARRPLHRTDGHRPARQAHRRRLHAGLRVQLRQPRRGPGRAGRRLVRPVRCPVRDRGRPAYSCRPQGWSLRPPQGGRPHRAARDRPDQRGGQGGARRPRAAQVHLHEQPLVRPGPDEGRDQAA